MERDDLILFLNYAIPLLRDGFNIGEIVDGYLKVKEFKEKILTL
jgi:hypothetical protein